MDFASQARGQRRPSGSTVATRARRMPISSKLAAAMVIGCAIVTSPASSRAQAPSKDLWQIYMDAAIASNQAGDFKTEAITLDAALVFAKKHDALGQRPPLTRLPLILAYVELERKDLFTNEGLRIDVGNLDDRMKDYIDSVARYGDSYLNRWQDYINPTSEDQFKHSARLYGAENSLRVEIALRQKLMTGDYDGLAAAQGALGLVLSKKADNTSRDQYSESIANLKVAQQRRVAMPKLSALFSVNDVSPASAEQGGTENQVNILLKGAANDVNAAYQGLIGNSSESYSAQLEHASKLYEEMQRLTSDVKKFWPLQPLFGKIAYEMAWLYEVEFRLAKAHPNLYQFPESFVKSKENYDLALSIMEYGNGPKSASVHNAASDYDSLFIAANLPEEAKKLEEHYGITPAK